MKKTEYLLVILLAAIIAYNLFIKEDTARLSNAIVTNVIDGDTLVISGGERVRLLGIDAPERGEFYYNGSKRRLEELADKKQVILESEGEDKDRYGRLLRYIILNETNINILLVKEGYAICYFYDDSRYEKQCKNYEEEAINKKLGIWKE